MTPSSDPDEFARDRLTWLLYLMAGTFGFALGSLGPAMPLLRDDLDISRTVGGLHFSVIAIGSVAVGFVADRLMRTVGRRALFWVGGSSIALGAAMIGIARHPAVSLVGAAAIGVGGATVLATGQSSLTDLHGPRRGVALAESNTASSIGTAVPALVIGALVAAGAGWRPAFVVPLLATGSLVVVCRRERLPPMSPSALGELGPMPRAYWWFWAALLPAIAAEWSVGAWGAGYLVDVGGSSEDVAATLMTAFFGSMVAGRLLTSRLARVHDPVWLLHRAAALGLVGILIFRLVDVVALIVVGLVLVGLGTSALFPMLLTLAVSTAPERSTTAMARVSIAGGTAVIVAPLTLGVVADQSSLQTAFGLVPVLYVFVVLLSRLGRRAGSPVGA